MCVNKLTRTLTHTCMHTSPTPALPLRFSALSVSLLPSRGFTFTHSLTLSHTPILLNSSPFFSPPSSCSLSLSRILAFSLLSPPILQISLTHTLSLSLSHNLFLFVCLFLSRAHACAHSLCVFLSLSFSHSRSSAYTLFFCLSFSLVDDRKQRATRKRWGLS